ncbi:MAG: hypothetical protein J5693_02550 [Bacteroidales bacterium]|nr:hypothetical protein [Bacteroidales bacterium]
MKKIIPLLIAAICLVSCNSVDCKLKKLEKACDDKNIEKAEKICASIDASTLTAEQAARLAESTVKLTALKAEKAVEDAAEEVKNIGETIQEALEDVSEEAKQTIEEAAQKVEEAVQE